MIQYTMKRIALLFWLLLGAALATAHGDESHETDKDILIKISSCTSFLARADRIECYATLCKPSYQCSELLLKAATEEGGPSMGMKVLEELIESPSFTIKSDGHELAHQVGRRTAKHFGINGESFLRCPSTFNYGCQHGFFEHALGQTSSAVDAATSICENIPSTLPPKDKFYCYHGVGHGVIMAEAYHLDRALSICDTLPSASAAEGCWQGVFMENVNGEMERIVSDEVFDDDDPLAPCNKVDEKYQWQCYINHAGYLVRFYNNSLKDAIHACLKASADVIPSCMQSLGLMVTNPGWQSVLAEPKKKGSFIETAIILCNDFPEQYQQDCQYAAIDNLLNFDGLAIERADQFCSHLKNDEKSACYQRIGLNLNNLVTSQDQKRKICKDVTKQFQQDCLTKTNRSTLQPGNSNKLTFTFQKIISLFSPIKKFTNFIILSLRKPDTKKDTKKIMTEEFDSPLIFSDDTLMEDTIKNFALTSVTQSLSRTGHKLGTDCHNRAHELGRMAYKLLGGDKALKECGVECHSGCRHGATEAFFAEKGTANLEENLNLLCNNESNGFFSHQCFHGVGHGLTAWADYDLPLALESCDLLTTIAAQSSCYTGVFMENIVGGFATGEEKISGHFTSYLSEDPQFPCNKVDDKYKNACYFLQTSRMIELFHYNFSKVAIECAKAPFPFQRPCFESMGRDVSGVNMRDPKKSIAVCNAIQDKKHSNQCLMGALQDQFWDISQSNGAIQFCEELVKTDFEQTCYEMIIQRATDVLLTPEMNKIFCNKIKPKYKENCNKAKPSKILEAKSLISAKKVEIQTQVRGDVIIYYANRRYTPNYITLPVGYTVTWVNNVEEDFWPASNIHPTHRIYYEFDPKRPINSGKNWSFTFTKKGIWRFHDHLYPRATGVVIVT